MESVELAVKEVSVEGGVVAKMVAVAEAGVIRTPMELEVAAQTLAGVKGYLKGIEAKYKRWTEGLNLSLKRIRDDYNPVKAAAQKAEAIWKDKIEVYEDEQDRKRREHEAKLREEAQKDAAKLEAAADKLEEKGKHDRADAKRMEAAAVPTPVIAAPEKPSTLTYREDWLYEVTDEKAIPDDYRVVDHQKLARVVKATKGSLKIPGIRQFPKRVVASAAR